jgi:hypothetical protein
MNSEKTISGTEAIHRMRMLKLVHGTYFSMIFYTCNLKEKTGGELRKVERCRLRAGLKEDEFKIDSDHYLPYEDLDTEKPRQCFKKLIRYVAFPPDYEMLKVKWYNE